MALSVLSHPLVDHHLARLRDEATRPEEFRALVQRLAILLAFDATADLEVKAIDIKTPLAVAKGHVIARRVGLIPILRAGLGMVDPLLQLIPNAEVWHFGLYRDKTTARPVEYYSRLPDGRPVEVALVLDPMLATGGSARAALSALRRWGVERLKLLSIIAAEEGIRRIQEEFPESEIHVCAIDPELNAQKFIVPGLGDAGDRSFNTSGDA